VESAALQGDRVCAPYALAARVLTPRAVELREPDSIVIESAEFSEFCFRQSGPAPKEPRQAPITRLRTAFERFEGNLRTLGTSGPAPIANLESLSHVRIQVLVSQADEATGPSQAPGEPGGGDRGVESLAPKRRIATSFRSRERALERASLGLRRPGRAPPWGTCVAARVSLSWSRATPLHEWRIHVPTWLWIVIIVIVVLAVLGYFGRGRLSR